MSYSHQVQTTVTPSGGSAASGSKGEVGSVAIDQSQTFPASATNTLWAVAFSHTTLQSLFLLSNKDVTVKTNSSGSPANTYNLKAGSPLVWGASDGYYGNPVSADVTAFYVTTGTAAATVTLKVLTN